MDYRRYLLLLLLLQQSAAAQYVQIPDSYRSAVDSAYKMIFETWQ